ncbi:N-acetyl sugar amidotransferase [Salidesulfovibrio onnuriiensis]|uniref:N-acetyl sugar amidotransferase n=1 Tax=Salidesulfovibrio onnuriiensis TaxID=2583823 RepID=UPI0011CB001B|nr:N-acetyl sugar amidotransferase [Salidesulfovibrio onnuriiensis]
MTTEYQICTRCLMDTSDPRIKFDEQGVCNHCHTYDLQEKRDLFPYEALVKIAKQVKADGKSKSYDCILGLSGGVDSSYVALTAHRLGLRCLAVHMDNGWNSELAVMNIENIVTRLGFDLYTHVINWEEFKDLQQAFFKAHVIDIEMLTDHAITAVMYNLARKHGVKYLLSGNNIVTESVLPHAWGHRKSDLANILAIHKKYGTVKLKTFPRCSTWEIFINQELRRIKTINVLNYLDYNVARAKQELMEELNWREYGGKHHESLFTRFYQTYILPTKFKVDKRRAHFSNLVLSGQMTKEEAQKELQKHPWSTETLAQDQEYIEKKLNITHEEFEEYLTTPEVDHYDYPNDEKTFWRVVKIRKLLRSLGR